jgi:hypothetical protein
MFVVPLLLTRTNTHVRLSDEQSARQMYKTLTCVWCRSELGATASSNPTGSASQDGPFINLAGAIPGIDGHRDTSTCECHFFTHSTMADRVHLGVDYRFRRLTGCGY